MDICKRPQLPSDVIGAACPVCGHTNLVHGGANNPTVDGCPICELQALIEEARS